jgi:hypothetical protein
MPPPCDMLVVRQPVWEHGVAVVIECDSHACDRHRAWGRERLLQLRYRASAHDHGLPSAYANRRPRRVHRGHSLSDPRAGVRMGRCSVLPEGELRNCHPIARPQVVGSNARNRQSTLCQRRFELSRFRRAVPSGRRIGVGKHFGCVAPRRGAPWSCLVGPPRSVAVAQHFAV